MSEVFNDEMCSEGSVTGWLDQAKAGDSTAISNLCRRYFEQLMRVARTRFGSSSRTVADEEDIANSVLDTLFRNAANGRFPDLHDRHDLWCLLLAITNQKVVSQIRENIRLKRGGGRVYTMTDLRARLQHELEISVASSPSHETIAVLSDLCNTLLARLGDSNSRQIAVLKLNGLSNREIAKELQLIPRTVDRKVNIIRERWLKEFDLLSKESDLTSEDPE